MLRFGLLLPAGIQEGSTTDVSASGAFLRTPARLTPGHELELEPLGLSHRRAVPRLTARIVRQGLPAPLRPGLAPASPEPGLGLRWRRAVGSDGLGSLAQFLREQLGAPVEAPLCDYLERWPAAADQRVVFDFERQAFLPLRPAAPPSTPSLPCPSPTGDPATPAEAGPPAAARRLPEPAPSSDELVAVLGEDLQRTQQLSLVGQMCRYVAHELRNCLAAVKFGCEELTLDAGLAEGQQELVGSLAGAVQNGLGLTQQLLDASRRPATETELVDLNEFLGASRRLLALALGSKAVLALELQPGLSRVRVSPQRLLQVLLNLTFNARDALGGGGRLVISTRMTGADGPADPSGPAVELVVQDSGAGMDPATLARVFDAQFTTKGGGRGAGLGLTIVRQIVAGFCGRISAQSEPGRGTAFSIRLPAGEPLPPH